MNEYIMWNNKIRVKFEGETEEYLYFNKFMFLC